MMSLCARCHLSIIHRSSLGPLSKCRFASQLSSDERTQALSKLSQGPFPWETLEDRDAIKKTFVFMDFNQAWRFMSGVALLAEKLDHHPEWFNVYNTVDVTLTTHDCSGLSKKDIAMAEAMDSFAHDLLPARSSE